MVKWSGVLALLLACAGCAPGLTPRQELTWDAYKTCQFQGAGSGRLDQVWPDGRWRISGATGEVNHLQDCMIRYWQTAARDRRVPALPPTFAFTNAGAPASDLGLHAAVPTWSHGDEWSFRSETPTGAATFVWIVDREEPIDGEPHYVIRSGSREIFYRKSDLAFSQETANGVLVVRSVPTRVRYVWPLRVGARWEQTFRTERPVDRQAYDVVSLVTVETEEVVTVPAGTFRTLKIVYRHKNTGATYYEEWYAPEISMLVRGREHLESGSRIRELSAYRRGTTANAEK